MTTELTKVAQQALKPHQIAQLVNKLRDIAREFHAHDCLRELISQEVNSALTQRPAAQTEREAFEAFAQNCPMGRYSVARRGDDYDSSHTQIMWDAWQACASLPAPQQATPEPDRDGEAFRTAARLGLTLRFYGGCAQSGMPGSPSAYEVVSAGGDPAAAMREAVERASAVIHAGGEAQKIATPEPLTGCNCRWQGEIQVEWCELHLAHKEAIHEWAERAKAAEAKLKATPEPVGEPALWVLTKQLEQRETTHRGYLWFSNPQNSSWTALYTRPAPGVPEDVQRDAERYRAINTPEIEDFLAAAHNEALHQRERWGSDQDAGKADADWLWLLGYLAGKAIHAQTNEKRLHHIITTAAACLNWHAARVGAWSSMRPGIDPAAHALAAAQAKGGE